MIIEFNPLEITQDAFIAMYSEEYTSLSREDSIFLLNEMSNLSFKYLDAYLTQHCHTLQTFVNYRRELKGYNK
jgi:hypothetical protein